VSEERELPKGWIWTKLAHVLPIQYGKGLTVANRISSGEVPVYGSNGIIGYHNQALTSRATLIIGRKGSVGSVHYSPVSCWPIDTTYFAEEELYINLKFFMHLLSTLNLKQFDKSTAVPGLNRDDYNALTIPLPPLAEQQRIVSVIEQQFSRQDVAIATLKRVQANLKRARTALLKEAVEGTLTQKWRQAHPGNESASTLLQCILDKRRARWEADLRAKGKDPKKARYAEPLAPKIEEDWESLPEEWCWANMGQIAYIQGGIQKQPSRKPVKNAFPYLRVANVLRGYLDLSHIEKMELFENELETLRLQPGDLLIVEGNGSKTEIGRSALWNGEIDDCVHQNHIIRVRTTNVLSKYLDYYWNSPRGRLRVMKAAASTNGLYTLSTDKIARIPIPLPPLAEQEQIVTEVERRLSQFEKQEALVKELLKSFEKQRQAILQRAFSGRLVPQDENDEPASVLLERIQQECKKREKKKAPRYLYPNMNGERFKVDPHEVVQEELWGHADKKVVAEQSELWQNTE
jgi:type I restriction enzyme, S subunit